MNPDWIQSEQTARRHGFARHVAPPDDMWPETGALSPVMQDPDASYMPQFEGPAFPQRPTHLNSSQNVYRRPTSQPYPPSYATSIGPQRVVETLAGPFDSTRTPNNPLQWGPPNHDPSRLTSILSAEDAQEGCRREVAQLGRKVAILHDELAKVREFKGKRYEELQKKCSDLEERVTGQGNLRDLLTAVEEKYKKILQENNEAIAVWLQAALEGLKEAGTTTEYKSASWNDHVEGDDLEDQGLLLEAQSNAFDFVK